MYALDQTKPLQKQELEMKSEILPPKPESRKIDRKQISIAPAVFERNISDDSSEPIDELPVKFQSAQKSLGTDTENECLRGITSIQEQPHKYSLRPGKAKAEENRNIQELHYNALRGKFNTKEFGKPSCSSA